MAMAMTMTVPMMAMPRMALGLQHSSRQLFSPLNMTSMSTSTAARVLACRARVPASANSFSTSCIRASASASASASTSTARLQTQPQKTATIPVQDQSKTKRTATAMDWNRFFQLRTSRRRYSLISSAIGALLTTTGTMYTLVEYQEQAENILKLVPTDPIVSMGIAVVAATFLGWLLGPIAGNGLWRVFHRQGLAEFNVKEKAFFERIKKHRVNPSGAGANNPVPDFYGEKIGSVAGYRRWLKDQRAFNRKRRTV